MSVREWALALREEHGVLTPAIVLEAARPETSPAHSYVFNVGVEEAAEQHYLERAHTLIRSVRVVVQAADNEPPRRVRFFYAIPGEKDAFTYEPLSVILGNPEKLEEARKAAERRLRDAESAIEDLEAAAANGVMETRAKRALASVRTAREELATGD